MTKSDKHSSLLPYIIHDALKKSYVTVPWGLYYKTLWIRNVQQMDKFRKKLVLFIDNHKHINFDKCTSLLQIPYITKLSCFILPAPGTFYFATE